MVHAFSTACAYGGAVESCDVGLEALSLSGHDDVWGSTSACMVHCFCSCAWPGQPTCLACTAECHISSTMAVMAGWSVCALAVMFTACASCPLRSLGMEALEVEVLGL